MTTQTQGLTQFGGSEKKQTQRQIELGVSKISGGAILYHSITDNQAIKLSTQQQGNAINLSYLNKYHKIKSVNYTLERFVKHRALIRFLDIWGRVNVEYLSRGLNGNNELSKSHSGIIGFLNNNKDTELIYKGKDKLWRTNDIQKLIDNYSHVEKITPLPDSGVEVAKNIARTLSE